MRIMSLREMLTELRHEARLSSSVSHGAHLEDRHVALLRRVQEEIYDEHEWPMLSTSATVSLGIGTQYGVYPTTLNMQDINEAWVRMDGEADWEPISYGIEVEHYNEKDSEANERGAAVRRWQHFIADGAEKINTNMFEVWPRATRTCTIRFAGKRKLRPLTNADTDHSTLDGPSIVLHAAAEILASQKAEDASLKLQKAQARIAKIRTAQSRPDDRKVSLYPTLGNRARVLKTT